VVKARVDLAGAVHSPEARWRAVEAHADRLVAMAMAAPAWLAGISRWRPRWWGPARRWWATSRVRSAAGWWLAAFDGCLERAHARLPGWWPEQLTSVLLLVGLVAADVEAWRWLPW
jgi:hypothetical protein